MEQTVYLCYLKKFKFRYRITKTVKTFSGGGDKAPLVGIRIEKQLCCDKNEYAQINYIGINKMDIKLYLKKLYDSSLTPKSMEEKMPAIYFI